MFVMQLKRIDTFSEVKKSNIGDETKIYVNS